MNSLLIASRVQHVSLCRSYVRWHSALPLYFPHTASALSQATLRFFCLQRLIYGGRQLAGSTRLSETGVQHGSTLFALARLLGGGGDGGSTGAESRSCYLEMYATKKADKVHGRTVEERPLARLFSLCFAVFRPQPSAVVIMCYDNVVLLCTQDPCSTSAPLIEGLKMLQRM